jgi:hypothetical protein
MLEDKSMVEGIVDLAYRDPDETDTWVVVDYKTDFRNEGATRRVSKSGLAVCVGYFTRVGNENKTGASTVLTLVPFSVTLSMIGVGIGFAADVRRGLPRRKLLRSSWACTGTSLAPTALVYVHLGLSPN